MRGYGLHECCYGFVVSGYASMGGPEKEPYTYLFWGFTWGGSRAFGIGRVVHDEPFMETDNEEAQ
jgi:hypothetical protein